MQDPALAFLNKVPDQCGYLVLVDGAVVKSDGDLANRESMALVAEKMANLMRFNFPGNSYKQLHVQYPDHTIVLEFSGKYLFVLKKKISRA